MQSSAEWRYWGRHDPMWSVATWKDRQRDGANPWNPEDFLAAGRSDCADIMRHWDHYGRLSGGTCLEIGCGAGRLTASLLDHFDRVTGLDVSPEQIGLARRLLGERASRVDFMIVDSPPDLPAASCNAMISTHVFQHLSSYSAIEQYLESAFRALVPGGSACFQIPVPGADKGRVPSLFSRALNAAITSTVRALGRRRFMEYNRYPASRITSTLSRAGYADIELRIFALRSTGFRQSFFFARKPVSLPPQASA